MSDKKEILKFISDVRTSLLNETFVKASFGNYQGTDPYLKKCTVRLVLIKREEMLSFSYQNKTNDIIKNLNVDEGLSRMESFLEEDGFRAATLFTQTDNLILQQLKNDKWTLRREVAVGRQKVALAHDRNKFRKIELKEQPYLKELVITDEAGKVLKSGQNKYKQINHYIEILSSLLEKLPRSEKLNILDMGAGKGYLTFALYDYLNNILNRPSEVRGVEFRKDLVDLCNTIAAKTGFHDLSFREGTIEDYHIGKKLDVLIALHACDTATDDAIYKGIKHEAELIVVAPCCQKQIRRELEKVRAKNDLDFMLRHGIYMERHAEMLTDSIRSLLLEHAGYTTKVFEFISDAHTPKNILIVGVRKGVDAEQQTQVQQKLNHIKEYFGIGYHYLERLMGL